MSECWFDDCRFRSWPSSCWSCKWLQLFCTDKHERGPGEPQCSRLQSLPYATNWCLHDTEPTRWDGSRRAGFRKRIEYRLPTRTWPDHPLGTDLERVHEGVTIARATGALRADDQDVETVTGVVCLDVIMAVRSLRRKRSTLNAVQDDRLV